MREKKFIRTLSCLCVVLMACGTAFAQQGKIPSGAYKGPMVPMAAPETPDVAPFYSNLVVDPCTSCNYSSANGYFILGPNNCFAPGSTQWISYPFIAGHSGTTRVVTLAITNYGVCTPTSFRFTVAIYSDDPNCLNIPGTQIGASAVATAPAAPCLTARARLAVALTQGVKYWVVVTTDATAQQIGTTAVWWQANTAWSDYNLNDGNGWIAFPPASPGGFSVQ